MLISLIIIITYWQVDGLKVCIDNNRVLQTDMVERLVYDHERKKRHSPFVCIFKLDYIFPLGGKNRFLSAIFSTEWYVFLQCLVVSCIKTLEAEWTKISLMTITIGE